MYCCFGIIRNAGWEKVRDHIWRVIQELHKWAILIVVHVHASRSLAVICPGQCPMSYSTVTSHFLPYMIASQVKYLKEYTVIADFFGHKGIIMSYLRTTASFSVLCFLHPAAVFAEHYQVCSYENN